jgi:hypothetical protein
MKIAGVERLAWTDNVIGEVDVPSGKLVLRSGYGSGLARRSGDAPDLFWAVGDRGPNLKVNAAIERYGLHHLSPLSDLSGAKIMPRPSIGPALAQFQLVGNEIRIVRELRLATSDGTPLSGLAHPGSDALLSEPVFDLSGTPLPPDPCGMDSEGLAAVSDGSFWVGDEFGPALVHFDATGRMIKRLLPTGSAPVDPGVEAAGLPQIASRRQLNRGFEALALSPDERWLMLGFQSPLAHPDEEAHRGGRHVRLWRLALSDGRVVAQYAYPLDPAAAFRRDVAKGSFERSDIKVSEILWLPDGSLLVLERGSETGKIYRCEIDPACELPAEHLDIAHRPTLEQLSAASATFPLPTLSKTLVLDTDDYTHVSADLEGMVMLAPDALLLVNDNDFGVEGGQTFFWRVSFERPLVRY